MRRAVEIVAMLGLGYSLGRLVGMFVPTFVLDVVVISALEVGMALAYAVWHANTQRKR